MGKGNGWWKLALDWRWPARTGGGWKRMRQKFWEEGGKKKKKLLAYNKQKPIYFKIQDIFTPIYRRIEVDKFNNQIKII